MSDRAGDKRKECRVATNCRPSGFSYLEVECVRACELASRQKGIVSSECGMDEPTTTKEKNGGNTHGDVRGGREWQVIV